MQVDLFDYDLPESLIAQTPLADRTASRLLTLDKRTGRIGHHRFEQLEQYLQAGDVLVLNDTRVIPARLFGVKADTGAKAEVLLLKPLEGDRWEALVRPAKRLKVGARLHFGGETGEQDSAPLLTATVESEGDMGSRVLQFSYKGIFNEILDRLGHMPLPPYIKEQLPEKERYQTVYAKHRGSAAAPTAGLHFTEEYLHRLEQKGIQLAYVTLHVGLGTFRPVSVENVEEHEMHKEYYEVSEKTAEVVNAARQKGGRVVAVGTTSARTLESAAREDGTLVSGKGWTGIFIYPGYPFRIVDALLTNFHLPKSTLLMLISALAGRERVLAAYKEAVEREYRFFSFGDAMFIY
ncbi:MULTISPECIES: tRNA preQ1(34) S-adenosylmethionine ribosyltransferase-isomerase QueA [Paenibacillus]|uniref:S-adenosylmethionine:tRNA ribosyltransferase-isomerase n=1 Tax=Paenibacillus naphthalenovorans TaxID=162209 RepID=A0A0U2UAH8_9BACL|nr:MULTISPECIES: tRNA preQ1(34) S-adenosylmethionine ribosyltransferase-isomerase QueA [Paenibacillus]ALS23208.1 S-adenosylmethionine:tRNA ribosyltransferase-isomerase [Paenibacillus naphthalenovorans]NTZ17204.1 tRNA preQ1(34) S-adenosylmethionine ribosyltransferase-isomerase QueA [Paenibacillus sp. JMULE4]GCL71675.1 tRNA preQ1(34) S-adenosylmethionine ribosyltransferase-isomerase QueA [Paenibacillus naphthalenovorans]SDI12803.1 S-adenosylmethionine:tRNA ribosyltransferase-isomerase [Paenibacil